MSEEKQVPHLLSRSFRVDAGSARMIHFATVVSGTPIKALKAPEFWANVASSLSPKARIEVMPEDGAYFAEFIVMSVGSNWARVELLREKQFVTAETVIAKAKDYEIKWGSPKTKWRVWRLSDKAVLKDGFDTPQQANEWLAANQEAMTA